MTDSPGQGRAQSAAQHLLEGLAPLCGLQVDTARVAFLLPLAQSLLEHGEQLVRTTAPAVEPYFICARRTSSVA